MHKNICRSLSEGFKIYDTDQKSFYYNMYIFKNEDIFKQLPQLIIKLKYIQGKYSKVSAKTRKKYPAQIKSFQEGD